jgi:hypothetical protein
LAGPGGWVEVLEKYGDLHLNLGHFGGANPAEKSDAWIWRIAIAAARFEFLFADVGNHKIYDEAVSKPYLNRLRDMFKDERTKAMQDHLMYGSDWYMLALYPEWEKFLSTYGDLYRAKFGADATDAFLGGNALRFLGFGDPDNENNRRLWERYQRYAPNRVPGWLAEPKPAPAPGPQRRRQSRGRAGGSPGGEQTMTDGLQDEAVRLDRVQQKLANEALRDEIENALTSGRISEVMISPREAERLDRGGTLEGVLDLPPLEAIVQRFGRPPLVVKDDEVELEPLPDFPADTDHRIRAVQSHVTSVGRVEFVNHANVWGGTGWVISEEDATTRVVATNRHVAKLVAARVDNAVGSSCARPSPACGTARRSTSRRRSTPTHAPRSRSGSPTSSTSPTTRRPMSHCSASKAQTCPPRCSWRLRRQRQVFALP